MWSRFPLESFDDEDTNMGMFIDFTFSNILDNHLDSIVRETLHIMSEDVLLTDDYACCEELNDL